MKFWEAIKAVQEGKKVKRAFFHIPPMNELDICSFLCKNNRDEIASNFTADWEVVHHPKVMKTIFELIPDLKLGKRAARSDWGFAFWIGGIQKDWTKSLDLRLEDIEAKDWFLLDD